VNGDQCHSVGPYAIGRTLLFTLHGMHEMQSILTDVRAVCLSRGSSRLRCAKMAEPIKVLFGVNTIGRPWSIVLKWVLTPHREGEVAQF